jgi:hypothetical protein
MRKYVAIHTDSEGIEHLYSLADNIDDAYDLFLENQDLWFDPIPNDTMNFNLQYSVKIHYPNVEINFGSTKPIKVVERTTLVGTYGQLETAFRIKYENEDPYGRWDIDVEELTVYGNRPEFVIFDEV